MFLEDFLRGSPGAPITRRPDAAARGHCAGSLGSLSFSGGNVQQPSGFILIIDGQTDGSDVLQGLHNQRKRERGGEGERESEKESEREGE